MCKAGFEILDVFPMSYSYPGGTDERFDKHDAVHFKNTVFKPAEQLLYEYFSPIVKQSLYYRLFHNNSSLFWIQPFYLLKCDISVRAAGHVIRNLGKKPKLT